MISFVKRLWAAAPVATVVMALALTAAALFAVRGISHAVYWRDPAHRAQPIEAWMTPGYISRAWDLPRDAVIEALDAPVPPPGGPMDLEELAAYRGVPLETLIAEAEALVAAHRAGGNGPDDAPPPPGDVPR